MTVLVNFNDQGVAVRFHLSYKNTDTAYLQFQLWSNCNAMTFVGRLCCYKVNFSLYLGHFLPGCIPLGALFYSDTNMAEPPSERTIEVIVGLQKYNLIFSGDSISRRSPAIFKV